MPNIHQKRGNRPKKTRSNHLSSINTIPIIPNKNLPRSVESALTMIPNGLPCQLLKGIDAACTPVHMEVKG